MQFKYKAINKDGKTREGAAEAEDQYALARTLKEQGETLVLAEEARSAQWYNKLVEQLNVLMSRIGAREKIIFTRNLSAMISAGLTISRGLEVMERQTSNKKFQSILQEIQTLVQEGKTLSAALAEHPNVFSTLFVSMVKAGEESGQLAESLEHLGVQMEKTEKLKKRIKGAMIYPSIVITAMVIVGIVMLIVVVPTLTSTFDELGVDLPRSTQIIISTSGFIQNNTILASLIFATALTALVMLYRKPKSRRAFEWTFLRIPVIGELVRFTNAARTARTMGSLLQSGVEIVTTITITRSVIQNSYYKDILKEAGEEVPRGGALADVFAQHESLYPPLVSEMISVGEETGNLSEMLSRIADFYEEEVDARTKNLSTIVEPILMIVIGAVVGFFAVSMITPIYSVGTSL